MKAFWQDIDDTRRRLVGGVVLYKGEPVYVSQVNGLSRNQTATITPLPCNAFAGGGEVVPIDKNDFEVRRLPTLGYVNTKDFAHYVMRKSIRNQFQCYHQNNINIQGDGQRIQSFQNLLALKGFKDMLADKYPKLKDAFEQIIEEDDPLKIAFDKRLAMHSNELGSVILEYRGTPVGTCIKPKRTGPVFDLSDRFAYLKEELTEKGVELAA